MRKLHFATVASVAATSHGPREFDRHGEWLKIAAEKDLAANGAERTICRDGIDGDTSRAIWVWGRGIDAVRGIPTSME